MTLFSKSELQSLTSHQTFPCISIYIPTHEAGRETRQDTIRLRNQLSDAEEKLKQAGIDSANSQKLLQPAFNLLENERFWQHQKSGLALLIAPGFFQTYRIPLSVETSTTVGERFYIKPLVSLLSNDGQFFILAASQGNVTLYQAARGQMQTVDLGDTPTSLEEALRYDDPEESLQGHGTGRSGSREIIHGQGGGKDGHNSDILRFFHLVSDGVEEALNQQNSPLLFVGVDFLFPIYQLANKYPHLMETAVAHQPDQLSPEEIRDRALEIITPHFAKRRQAAAEQFGSLLNQNQASQDLAQILNAAHNGQIDALFVADDAHVWGTFDAEARQLNPHASRTDESEELLDLAIAKAIETDAEVYIVPNCDIPVEGVIAATLRYPIMQEAKAVAV
ncbi:MAG: hypothetical protein AAFQ40_13765 [Cyanobacteria bacterium J06623_5]